jgi:hypothetical protein
VIFAAKITTDDYAPPNLERQHCRAGRFRQLPLRAKSQGSATPEEVKAGNVKRVLPRFTPGKEFRQVLNNTEFVKNGS